MKLLVTLSLILLCLITIPAQADDTPLPADLRTAFSTALEINASAVTETAEHPIGKLWASTRLHSILIGAWGHGADSEGAVVLTRRCGDGRCSAHVLKLGKVSRPAVAALVDLEGDGGELTAEEWEKVLEPTRSETAKRPALLLRVQHVEPPPSKHRGIGLLLYPLQSDTPVWTFTAAVHDGDKIIQRNKKLIFEKGLGPVLDIVTDETRFRWDDGIYKPLK